MNREESDFDMAKPIRRSCCVIFAFQARGACFSLYKDFFNQHTTEVFVAE